MGGAEDGDRTGGPFPEAQFSRGGVDEHRRGGERVDDAFHAST